MKEWKMFQRLYNQMVIEHSDDKSNFQEVVEKEVVNNAINFFHVQDPIAIYPAKSYAVAVIYALLLEEYYGEDVYESLNDPDLLNRQDEYFVLYKEDPESYDAIIKHVKGLSDWKVGGWVPYTVNYFKLECTQEGLESINQ